MLIVWQVHVGELSRQALASWRFHLVQLEFLVHLKDSQKQANVFSLRNNISGRRKAI